MVPVEDKVAFLEALVVNDVVNDASIQLFLKELIFHPALLNRINFVEHETNVYNYLIIINLKGDVPVIWIKEKVYKDMRLLKSILHLLYTTTVPIYIYIDDHQHRVKTIIHKIAYHTNLVQDVLFDVFIDYAILDYKLNQLRNEIDKTLDEGDKETFMMLSKQLRELSLCH